RVGGVQLVEVDPVGLQAAEGGFDGEADVAAGAAGAPVRPVGALHVHAELGCEHDFVAAAAEGVTHQGFAQPAFAAVDVGGVEQRDAGVDRGVHDGVGAFLRFGGRSRSPEVVAPQPDGGYD